MVRTLVVSALCACLALAIGCSGKNEQMPKPSFQFAVHDVFYIKPPVDRVIVTGVMEEGAVHPGEPATVHCRSGAIDVIVEGIEGFRQGELKEAAKGDRVGLRLTGITKDQPASGDKVIGRP